MGDILCGKPLSRLVFYGIDIITRIDSRTPAWRIFDRRDHFDIGQATVGIVRIETVFTYIEADTAVFAFGCISHLLKKIIIEIERIRVVKIGEHPVHSALEKNIGVDFINIIVLKDVESRFQISDIFLSVPASGCLGRSHRREQDDG